MKDKSSPTKTLSSHVEMFANENYLNKLQDTEFKRAAINSINQLQEFKEDSRTQRSILVNLKRINKKLKVISTQVIHETTQSKG